MYEFMRFVLRFVRTRPEETPDGWIVENLEIFRYLVDNSPPRPGRVLRQLAIDARALATWIMWGTGIGLIALGVWFESWILSILGVVILVQYVRIFLRYLAGIKHQAIYRGTIDTLTPHLLSDAWAIADARLHNGQVMQVAVGRDLVSKIMVDGKPAEVMFDHGEHSEYGGVIAARAVQ